MNLDKTYNIERITLGELDFFESYTKTTLAEFMQEGKMPALGLKALAIIAAKREFGPGGYNPEEIELLDFTQVAQAWGLVPREEQEQPKSD